MTSGPSHPSVFARGGSAIWYIGVDLHRRSLTIAAVHDSGQVRPPVRFDCQDTDQILAAFTALTPFRAVIEATSTYRWLHDLLCPHGTVVLAHPQRLRAMTLRRSKTDRLDNQLLAQLLRLNQIPLRPMRPIRLALNLQDDRPVHDPIQERHRQRRVAQILALRLEVDVRYQRRRALLAAGVDQLVQQARRLTRFDPLEPGWMTRDCRIRPW